MNDYFVCLLYATNISKASAYGLRSILNSQQTGFGYLKPVEVQIVIIIFSSL